MTTPVHVHGTVPMMHSPEEVGEYLRANAHLLAVVATARAHESVTSLARSGGFRSRAVPSVEARLSEDDELGCVTVRWDGDEDATAWPAMTSWLVPLWATSGSRLALVSPRHPGVDLSTNRIDKLWRDRLARTAVHAFLTTIAQLIDLGAGTPAPSASADGGPVTESDAALVDASA